MDTERPLWITAIYAVRAITGFLYGSVVWHDLTLKDFETSPFWSAFKAVVWGTLGIFAAEACSLLSLRPIGDVVVIFALLLSAKLKLGY
jgi:hypothetical protein